MATTYMLNATVYLPMPVVYDNLLSHIAQRSEGLFGAPWSLIQVDENLTLMQQRSIYLLGYTSKFYMSSLGDPSQHIAFHILLVEEQEADTSVRITVSHPIGRFHPDDASTLSAHLTLYRRCIKVAELLLDFCNAASPSSEDQIAGFFRKLLGSEKEKRKR
jgi:hypothetical protein